MYHRPIRGAVANKDASKRRATILGFRFSGKVLCIAKNIAATITVPETVPKLMPNAR